MEGQNIMNYYFNIKINDRIDGEDRFERYEDPIDMYLTNHDLGEILNTGTMINDAGEVEYFDIEISLTKNDELTLDGLVLFLESLNPPKGSILNALSDEDDLDHDINHDITRDEVDAESEVFNSDDELVLDDEDDNAIEFEYRDDLTESKGLTTIEFGRAEGIAIYLDRINLPESLFEQYDIHELIADIEIALEIDESGENDHLPLRCFELNDYTSLCFYGDSFHEMQVALASIIETHPLCQGAKINRIA
jgi:hypothetical protein